MKKDIGINKKIKREILKGLKEFIGQIIRRENILF